MGSAVKYIIFAITQSVFNISTEISHADRGTINMNHVKRNFWSKACVPPPDGLRWWGQKFKIQPFSEHSHVAYLIKGNHECNSKVASILPADPTPTSATWSWGWGQKVKILLFQNMVMLHINFKGITNAATWQQIIFPCRPPAPDPWDGVNRSKVNLFRT